MTAASPNDQSIRNFVSSSFSMLSPNQRWRLVLLAVARSITSGIDLAAIVLLGIGVDRLSRADGSGSTALLFVAGGVMMGRSLITLLISRVTFRSLAQIEIELGRQFTSEVFSAQQEILDSFRMQEMGYALSQGTNSLTTRALGFSMIALADGLAAVALVAGFTVLYPIEGALMVVSVCTLMLPVQRLVNRRIEVATRKWSKSVIQLLNEVQEFQMSRREIFLSNASEKASRGLDGYRQRAARQASNFNFLLTVPRVVIEIAMLAMAGVLLVVAYVRMSADELLVFSATLMAITFRVAPMAMGVVGAIGVVSQSLGETTVNREIRRKVIDNDRSTVEEDRVSTPTNIGHAISLDAVSYSFPGSTSKILDDVSLQVEHHQLCALVGKSGAGKTTLLECIVGLRQVTEGSVTLFEMPPTRLRVDQPGAIGLVPQQPAVRSGTLAENVTLLSSGTVDRSRVEQLLIDVGLTDLLQRSPDGIDLMVGESNLQLSGGERQRLGLARALYNDPKILVLDEPTSALDGLTEEHVFELIEQQRENRTIVVVTHRRPTGFRFDRVFRIADGKVLQDSPT